MMNRRQDVIRRKRRALVGCGLLVGAILCAAPRTSAQAESERFVAEGEPLSALGSGTDEMTRRGDALVLPARERWGNTLEAGLPLKKGEFRVEARLTLPELSGSGASFIMGGGYHTAFPPPEGRHAMQIWLDGADGKMYVLDHTGRKGGNWPFKNKVDRAERNRIRRSGRRPVAEAANYITPGEPFTFELAHEGGTFMLRIDGEKVFAEKLQLRRWPANFGFLAEGAAVRIHRFAAHGSFVRPRIEHTKVWQIGRDGYNVYRGPAMVTLPDGTVLAFAQARRPGPNRGEVDCVMKRSTDGGRTWSDQQMVWDPGDARFYARGPSVVVDRQRGAVHVVACSNIPRPGEDEPARRRLFIVSSDDGGRTWSDARPLGLIREQMKHLTAAPARGIQLQRGPHKGRLVVPGYAGVEGAFRSCVFYSDDHGRTWCLSELAGGKGTNESTVVELADGRVLLSVRRGGHRAYLSDDGGATFERAEWSIPRHTGVDAALLRHSWPDEAKDRPGHILFSHPTTGHRRRMVVKMSDDEARNWSAKRLVYPGGAAYSGMTVLPNGAVGLLYEKDDYRTLSFVRFRAGWVRGE